VLTQQKTELDQMKFKNKVRFWLANFPGKYSY